MEVIIHNLEHGLVITAFVFVMMMLVDYINVLTAGRLTTLMRGARARQLIVASLLGALPGCLGTFMVVSFYVRGMVSFAALVGCMIATSGDESFVMFGVIPKQALFIHCILFFIGVGAAFLVDTVTRRLKLKDPCVECGAQHIHAEDRGYVLAFEDCLRFFKKISFARFLLISLFALLLYASISGRVGLYQESWQRISFTSLMFVALFIVSTVSEHYLEQHI
ncbi:MAG: selenocysteine protein, partial [Candidatus Omnitrophota bacterium]